LSTSTGLGTGQPIPLEHPTQVDTSQTSVLLHALRHCDFVTVCATVFEKLSIAFFIVQNTTQDPFSKLDRCCTPPTAELSLINKLMRESCLCAPHHPYSCAPQIKHLSGACLLSTQISKKSFHPLSPPPSPFAPLRHTSINLLFASALTSSVVFSPFDFHTPAFSTLLSPSLRFHDHVIDIAHVNRVFDLCISKVLPRRWHYHSANVQRISHTCSSAHTLGSCVRKRFLES
jgi:hypothetical protein